MGWPAFPTAWRGWRRTKLAPRSSSCTSRRRRELELILSSETDVWHRTRTHRNSTKESVDRYTLLYSDSYIHDEAPCGRWHNLK